MAGASLSSSSALNEIFYLWKFRSESCSSIVSRGVGQWVKRNSFKVWQSAISFVVAFFSWPARAQATRASSASYGMKCATMWRVHHFLFLRFDGPCCPTSLFLHASAVLRSPAVTIVSRRSYKGKVLVRDFESVFASIRVHLICCGIFLLCVIAQRKRSASSDWDCYV